MALIRCAECGKEVSDNAAACLGCGAPVTPTPAPGRARGLTKWETAAIVVAATVAMAAISMRWGHLF